MELIDRKSALDLGLTTYFTGKPCKRGHVSERKVDSGVCVECSVGYTRAWRENGSKAKDTYNSAGKPLPSQSFLRECFDYIFSTGELVWRERPEYHFKTKRGQKTFNTRFTGKVAGHYHSRNGYLEVRFDRLLYKGHRIIYKLLTGEDPDGILDHIDGDVSNNRVENLRLATSQENARNGAKRSKAGRATSKYKGVSKHRLQWIVSLSVSDNETRIVEKFKTEIEAALRYDELAVQYFGEFAQLNFPNGVLEK